MFLLGYQEERKRRRMNLWDKINLKIGESELALKIVEKFGEKLMEEVREEVKKLEQDYWTAVGSL